MRSASIIVARFAADHGVLSEDLECAEFVFEKERYKEKSLELNPDQPEIKKAVEALKVKK